MLSKATRSAMQDFNASPVLSHAMVVSVQLASASQAFIHNLENSRIQRSGPTSIPFSRHAPGDQKAVSRRQ